MEPNLTRHHPRVLKSRINETLRVVQVLFLKHVASQSIRWKGVASWRIPYAYSSRKTVWILKTKVGDLLRQPPTFEIHHIFPSSYGSSQSSA